MDPKIAEFQSYVPLGGIDIQVIVEITRYTPGSPARLHGHPDTWHEHEPPEIELDVRDYKGRRNAALKELLEEEDIIRLEDEALEHMLAIINND